MLRVIISAILCGLICFSQAPLSARTITIPETYPTIQTGIDVAVDGDTLLVSPGSYIEAVSFAGKNITIGSLFLTTSDSSYIESTIIYSPDSDLHSVNFIGGETAEARLIGFSIGSSLAIKCVRASPMIMHNKIDTWFLGISCDSVSSPCIKANTITHTSRAITAHNGSSPQIIDNNITPKASSGTGIFIVNSSAIISGNTIKNAYKAIETWDAQHINITGNRILNSTSGINIKSDQPSYIVNNLINNCMLGISCYTPDVNLTNNTIVKSRSCGIRKVNSGSLTITNCILWDNETNISDRINTTVANSCIENGFSADIEDLGGNTFRSPRFTDADSDDFTLMLSSPCVDGGLQDTTALHLPDLDLTGTDRFQDGSGNGSATIDMGCYEAKTVENPAVIKGKITLSGGTGSVEDVCVAIGAPIHPDSEGNYSLTIGAADSPYTIQASLSNYLTQTSTELEVNPGSTIEYIDFELSYYQPDSYLSFSSDSILFPQGMMQNFTIKNISLTEVMIYSASFDHNQEYFMCDNTLPQILSPEDTLQICIYPIIPTKEKNSNKNMLVDNLQISTSIGSFSFPTIWSPLGIGSDDTANKPESDKLLGNYPNPFNPTTTISYVLTESADVKLSVFNLKGEQVDVLHLGNQEPGIKKIDFDGSNLTSGMYLYMLMVNGKQIAFKKMMMVK